MFIIINDITYTIGSNNLREAVRFFYKAFVSLQIDFSAECKHIWRFLQTYIFKNKVQRPRTYNNVSTLCDELSTIRLRKEQQKQVQQVDQPKEQIEN